MRQIRATHRYAFRPGEWAELVGEIKADIGGRPGRQCHVLRFDDGTIDLWPVDDPAAGYEFRDLRLEHPVAVHIAIVDGRPAAASLQPISMVRVEQLQAEHGRAPGDGTVQLLLKGVEPPPFNHALSIADDYSDLVCSCGEWSSAGLAGATTQYGSHAEHVRDEVALLLVAAKTTDRPDQIPGPDSSTFLDELHGYLIQASEDGAPLDRQDLLAYYRDLRKRYLKPIRDWMSRTLDEGVGE